MYEILVHHADNTITCHDWLNEVKCSDFRDMINYIMFNVYPRTTEPFIDLFYNKELIAVYQNKASGLNLIYANV